MKSSKSDRFGSLLRSYRNQTEHMNQGEEKRNAVVGNDDNGMCEFCGCLSGLAICDCLECVACS